MCAPWGAVWRDVFFIGVNLVVGCLCELASMHFLNGGVDSSCRRVSCERGSGYIGASGAVWRSIGGSSRSSCCVCGWRCCVCGWSCGVADLLL